MRVQNTFPRGDSLWFDSTNSIQHIHFFAEERTEIRYGPRIWEENAQMKIYDCCCCNTSTHAYINFRRHSHSSNLLPFDSQHPAFTIASLAVCICVHCTYYVHQTNIYGCIWCCFYKTRVQDVTNLQMVQTTNKREWIDQAKSRARINVCTCAKKKCFSVRRTNKNCFVN